MKKLILRFSSILILLVSSSSFSSEWVVTANVDAVESTYIPNRVSFAVSPGAGNCKSWMNWNGQGSTDQDRKENTKAALNLLTTALISGKKVRLEGINQNCVVQYLHLLRQ